MNSKPFEVTFCQAYYQEKAGAYSNPTFLTLLSMKSARCNQVFVLIELVLSEPVHMLVYMFYITFSLLRLFFLHCTHTILLY